MKIILYDNGCPKIWFYGCPQLSRKVPIPIQENMMISFISQSSGEKVNLKRGESLGFGTYGEVYALENKDAITDLVCKVIKVDIESDAQDMAALEAAFDDYNLNLMGGITVKSQDGLNPIHFNRDYRFKIVLNEIYRLHELGLLVGYGRENDTFYIIMDRIHGTRLDLFEKTEPGLDLETVYYEGFKKIKDLHRLGYAHLDCQVQNFMVLNENPKKVVLLDFGFVERVGYLNSIIDCNIFLQSVLRDKPIWLVKFYFNELGEYLRAHKSKVIFESLGLIALSYSAVYGIPCLSVTSQATQSFIGSIMMKKLASEFSPGVKSSIIPHTLLNIFFTYLGLQTNWKEGPVALMNLEENRFDLIAWLNAAYLYYPITQAIETASIFADIYIIPEVIQKKRTDLLFQYVYPTTSRLASKAKEVLFGNETKVEKLKLI